MSLRGATILGDAAGAQRVFDPGWVATVDFGAAAFSRAPGTSRIYAVLPSSTEPPVAILVDLTRAAAGQNPAHWPPDWLETSGRALVSLSVSEAERQAEATREAERDRESMFRVATGVREDTADRKAALTGAVTESAGEVASAVVVGAGRVAAGITSAAAKVAGAGAGAFLRGLGPWITVGLAVAVAGGVGFAAWKVTR